jgi:hypothetical protein
MSEWAQEKFLYRVTMDANNAVLTVTEEGGGAVLVSVAAGYYWVHDDASMEATHPSLITAVEAALNGSGSLSGTYTCSASTPTESPALGAFGIKVTATGITDFTFACGATSTATKPTAAMCLGLPHVTEGRAISSVGTVLYSPYSYAGCWASPVWRSEATPDEVALTFASTEYREQEDAYAMSYGSQHKRAWRYIHVPAAHVFEGRADIQAYATTGEVGLGDDHNALQYLYRESQRLSDILVVAYPPGEDADLTVDDTHPYEVVRMSSYDAFSGIQRRSRDAGEYHTLTWETCRVSGDLEY